MIRRVNPHFLYLNRQLIGLIVTILPMKKNVLFSGTRFLYLISLVLVYQAHVFPGIAQRDLSGPINYEGRNSNQSSMSSGTTGFTEGIDLTRSYTDGSSLFAIPQTDNTELGNTAFVINLGGLLFFGPTFRFEFRVGPSAVVDAHLRWAFAGVLYQALVTDFWYEDVTVLPYSLGVGTGFKFLLGNPDRPHRFYAGSIIEYNYGGSTSDFGKEERNHAVVIGGDLGMRWRSETGFMFSLGIQPAVAFVVKDGYFYEESPDVWHDYGFSVRPAPILELSIGWEFGK